MDVEPLPHSSISTILGLLEVLDDHGGREDIYKLARELNYEFGDLLTVLKAAEMVGFVHTPGGDVEIVELGRKILKSDINTRKKIFGDQIKRLKLFSHLSRMLHKSEENKIDKETVLQELARLLPHEHPEQVFKTLVDWSRYAELFGYNQDTEQLYLDRQEPA